jgi:hypothetical protein
MTRFGRCRGVWSLFLLVALFLLAAAVLYAAIVDDAAAASRDYRVLLFGAAE